MKDKVIAIVGAGLTGCTISRVLADSGYDCHVFDSRNHIAGNAYDFKNEHGITEHLYGPHLFHTKNEVVFKFLSQFTEWTPYKHKVKAMLSDGDLVTLPPNRETARIVGKENIIETFFRPYSEKMWGMKLEDIDPTILSRVPIREDDNEYYFPNDPHQCLPDKGYRQMCEVMLDHPRIVTTLNHSFDPEETLGYKHTFYTGPIDVFFEFKHGRLAYRSIKFERVHLPIPRAFPVATVNFTHTENILESRSGKIFPTMGIIPAPHP